MKPRLEPAPYTKEDSDVWICVGLWQCFALNDSLELASAIGDRGDANLMLEAQKRRNWPWVQWRDQTVIVRGVPVGFGKALRSALE